MLFNSAEFAIFFPIVMFGYFALAHRWRWPFLLAASYLFYMAWNPAYVALLLLATAICYMGGLLIGGTFVEARRRLWLALTAASTLGLLFFFKYYDFFADTLRPLVPFSVPESPFLLPLGISFYTLQALGYVVDVYRGTQVPERHAGRFALYVVYFPQLVAGPIERAAHLLPQLRRQHEFHYDRVTDGMKLMLWGLFKKMVIADRLAILVDHVYAAPGQFEGPALTLATVFFAFQIYCDFSGYSDIAIGASRVFGIRLMANFWRPYSARSISEFWRRWHISLSTWFRDYLYIPLGGNRVSHARWWFNILVVFLVSGLWHGANWTFLIWGGLHGGYMIAGRLLWPYRERTAAFVGLDRHERLHSAMQLITTFGLVCFAWIFFRAASLSDALFIVTHLHTGWTGLLQPDKAMALVSATGLTLHEFVFVVALLALLELVQMGMAKGSVLMWLVERPIYVRWLVYSAMVWSILLFGVFKHKEFIYFTF